MIFSVPTSPAPVISATSASMRARSSSIDAVACAAAFCSASLTRACDRLRAEAQQAVLDEDVD